MIFFDFDGTISDAKRIAYASFVRTLKEFGHEFDDKRLKELMGTKMEEIVKKLGDGNWGYNAKGVEKIRRRFYQYFTEAAIGGGIKPCVSLKPLWELKKDYPLVVVSNSERDFLRVSIKKLGLGKLFSGVYGAEKGKGKDEILKRLFRKFGINATEAVYVGDRFSDVDFARDAGCVAVAIHNSSSWSTLARIKRERPDFIVRDFYGFRKVVEKLDDAE